MSLILDNVGHHFGSAAWLFRTLYYELSEGNTYAIIGPSGSGKSTLLGILAGWISPSSGTVLRTGGAKTTWVFQNPHGVAKRTALDHVVLPLVAQGLRRGAAEGRARELMDVFGIGDLEGRRFGELSGGEAQRLMFARGVASSPDLLLIDEPTAQLDPESAEAVNKVLAFTAQQGAVVAVATHDVRTMQRCRSVLDLSEYSAVGLRSGGS